MDHKPRSIIESFRNRSGHSLRSSSSPSEPFLSRNAQQQFAALKDDVGQLQDDNEILKLEARNLKVQIVELTGKLRFLEEKIDSPKLSIWERLKISLLNRPPIDVLKSRKIYKNEPCFNTELLSVPMDPNTGVPKIVVVCCYLIEKTLLEISTQITESCENFNEANQVIQGIYRIPGDSVEIQKLRFKINDNRYQYLESERNIHTVASLLKLFFFELTTPVLRDIDFLKSLEVNPQIFAKLTIDGKIANLRNFVDQQPVEQYRLLKYFILHLTRLTFTYTDLVTSKSLSVSIGPSIIHIVRHFEDLQYRTEHQMLMNEYLNYLIQYSDFIFPSPVLKTTDV